MVWESFVDLRAAPQYLASLLMLGLAAWLLVLNRKSALNCAFALVLGLRAGTILLATLAALVPPESPASIRLAAAGGYFYLAFFPALAYFVSIYPDRRGWIGKSAAGPWTMAGLALLLCVAYLVDPALWLAPNPTNPATTLVGPLAALSPFLALSLAGLLLIYRHVRAAPGERKAALLLVGGVFIVNGLFDGASTLLRYLQAVAGSPVDGIAAFLYNGFSPENVGFVPSPWARLAIVAAPLSLIPCLWAMGLLALHWRRNPGEAPYRKRFLVAAALAVASALLASLLSPLVKSGGFALFIIGLWRVAIPLVVTYSILRHQLFDIDLKLKTGLRRSVVLAAFVLVFFAVSEAAEGFVEDRFGPLVGLLAAGVLTFALRPLERVSDRFVDGLMPSVRDTEDYRATRKAEVYRASARLALRDGRVTEAEERTLHDLAEELGFPPARARSLLEEVRAELAAAAASPAPLVRAT